MAIETPARIAIVGAGPIGLETALYARYLGYQVDLYERGRVAEQVRGWGHARLFSPFALNRSPLGLAALKAQDSNWQAPAEDALLTGQEFTDRYLIPLAQSDLLSDGLHEQTEVVSIGRAALRKGEDPAGAAREESDFQLLLRSTAPDAQGRESFATADVVIDASGRGQHNWLGAGGVPALGELAAQTQIEYGMPDVLGARRGHYAGRNILLIGDDDLAAANLAALASLASQTPDTWITWLTRAVADEATDRPIAVGGEDFLAERARVADAANRLAADDAHHVSWRSGTTVESIVWHAASDRFSVRLAGKHAGELECDRVIANLGFRPDVRIFEELHVELAAWSDGVARLAAALADQNSSSGGEPAACDPQCLITGERDFYILGSKSYGRDSRFLLRDGLEQIRALFTILGDRPELNLYATMAGLY